MSGAVGRTRRARAWGLLAAALLAWPARTPLAAQPDATAILRGLRVNTGRSIDFHAARYPDTVYVGEQVTYQVAVLLSEEARARLRRNPEFVPPELRGMLAYELGRPVRQGATANGTVYDAYVFQRALFPVVAGQLTIPAPSLTYALPQSTSFFSREERASVRAESLSVVVRPLPAEGRPADFAGAVGSLRATVRLDTAGLRVGDPVVLTMRVEGTGNIRLLPRPRIEVPWGSLVPGTERLTLDTAGAAVRGSKEFDWILTPAAVGDDTLPSLRYPYFDPARGVYAEAVTDPLAVRVEASVSRAADGEAVAPLDPLRRWDASAGEPWAVRFERARRGWLVAWGAAPVLVGLMLAGAYWRRGRVRARGANTRLGSARALQADGGRAAMGPAAAPGDTPGDAARLRRRRLLEAVASRLAVSQEALVGRDAFERVLRRHGVSRETAALALLLRDQLEAEGFGGMAAEDAHGGGRDAPPARPSAQADDAVRAVVARIAEEAVPQGARTRGRRGTRVREGRGALPVVVLLAAGALFAVPALVTASARQAADGGLGGGGGAGQVAQAQAAYEARQFVRAAAVLEAAVAARPHDVALLANWGTAAWAAGDTVGAVVAWQRAARLQPWAGDLQANMARLPAGAHTGGAAVPLVPVAAAWLLASALWGVGWAVIAWGWWPRRGREREERGPVLLPALLLAAALGVGGWGLWGRARLAGARLAVVLRPETLRGAPAPDAPTAGGVGTGEVVTRVVVREGWARVRHADGREGWLPLVRLRPLLPSGGPE